MIKPKVIHPRKVLLYKRDETEIDSEFGVTGKITWQEPIELYGQVKYDKFQALNPINSGNNPVSAGHIVFYDKDWVEAALKFLYCSQLKPYSLKNFRLNFKIRPWSSLLL